MPRDLPVRRRESASGFRTGGLSTSKKSEGDAGPVRHEPRAKLWAYSDVVRPEQFQAWSDSAFDLLLRAGGVTLAVTTVLVGESPLPC